MQVILTVDQGTTNTKALLVNREGRVVTTASCPVGVEFPQPGWVEQDAERIWTSVRAAIDQCLRSAPPVEIVALGLTNQRETVVAWDRRTGKPVGPAIVWQCRRTSARCERLEQQGLAAGIRSRSGLALDPLFSASKIAWILGQVPDGFARASTGELCAGTVDSWLLWNLTGGAVHSTDVSNASRTQLFNIHTLAWDPFLLDAFGVPLACLPAVHASSTVHAVTAATGLLAAGIPIAALAGDSHAALFGHGAFEPGIVKATYGTGSSLMTLLPEPVASRHGLSTTVAWSLGHAARHALEGNITNTGGAVDWLASFLCLSGGASDVAALAETVLDSRGVFVVPAFAGLGAPHWDAHARGLFSGLTRGTTQAHVARATIEAIAFQIADVYDAMCRDTGLTARVLLTDGGASANNQLMQFQADVIDAPVVRNESGDVAAIGAAWLAGLATGFWHSTGELASLPRTTTRFEPSMPASQRDELRNGWRDALHRAAGEANRRC